jgi:CRP-like cAMP-binding protein
MNPLWSNIFRKKMDEESLSYFLGKVPIFADLGARELTSLEELVHPRRYDPRETVFEEGDPGSGMYLVRTGHIQIFARQVDGSEEELALLGPGDFFGETTLAAPSPRTASARSLDHCELLGLFRADLLATTQKYPTVANKILMGLTRVISERLQAAGIEIRRLKTAAAVTPAGE